MSTRTIRPVKNRNSNSSVTAIAYPRIADEAFGECETLVFSLFSGAAVAAALEAAAAGVLAAGTLAGDGGFTSGFVALERGAATGKGTIAGINSGADTFAGHVGSSTDSGTGHVPGAPTDSVGGKVAGSAADADSGANAGTAGDSETVPVSVSGVDSATGHDPDVGEEDCTSVD